MKEPKFPKQSEIDKLSAKLKKDKPEGYLFSIKLLSKGANTEYFLAEDEFEFAMIADIYSRQMEAIKSLKSVKARALAIMVTDFLNGDLEAKKYLL